MAVCQLLVQRLPLVLDLALGGIPVAVTCWALGFSKQASYAWKNNPVSQWDWDEPHLIKPGRRPMMTWSTASSPGLSQMHCG